MMKNIITDNISVRGYSHIREDKECQDSSLCWQTDSYAAVIVCDGHGGDKYIRSAQGSKIACEAGKRAIDEFMGRIYTKKPFSLGTYASAINVTNSDKLLSQLERSIIASWNEQTEKSCAVSPLDTDERWEALSEADKRSLKKTPQKAYGSTFLAGVISYDFCFLLKLGDGNANVIKSNELVYSPEELSDDALQFNLTSSLSGSDADVAFRHYFAEIQKGEECRICGIALSSDGVINCFRSPEAYCSFIRNVYTAYGEEKAEDARRELSEALAVFSERGSGDDLSVALIRHEIREKAREQTKQKKTAAVKDSASADALAKPIAKKPSCSRCIHRDKCKRRKHKKGTFLRRIFKI